METERLPVDEVQELLANTDLTGKTEREKESEINKIERESTRAISYFLYRYKKQELTDEFENPQESEDFFREKLSNLRLEDLDKNIQNFYTQTKQDSKLQAVHNIEKQFPEAEIYFVGGCVRDGMANIRHDDYDFIVKGIDSKSLKNFLEKYGEVKSSGSEYGSYKLTTTEGLALDFALPREEKSKNTGLARDFEVKVDANMPLEKDLPRRDFSINAMALNWKNGQIIDLFNGRKDMVDKTIRAIGNPDRKISEYYLRIFRAIKTAAKLGFVIEPETRDAIKKNVSKIETFNTDAQKAVYKRIGVELLKSFCCDPVRTLDLLNDLDILEVILPEIKAMQGVEQPSEHHMEDVYTHARLALKSLPENSPASLVFATLLHDVGKPETAGIKENGQIGFDNHANYGANMADAICKRFGFSEEFAQDVSYLISKHMKVFDSQSMRGEKFLEYFDNKLKSDVASLLVRLNKADSLSSMRELKAETYADISGKDRDRVKKLGIDLDYVKDRIDADAVMHFNLINRIKKMIEASSFLEKQGKTEEEILLTLKDDLTIETNIVRLGVVKYDEREEYVKKYKQLREEKLGKQEILEILKKEIDENQI